MGCERLEASLQQRQERLLNQTESKLEVNFLFFERKNIFYLDFVSVAGLLTATFGEEGSSWMVEAGGGATEAEDEPKDNGVGWFFSDLSALSDLEERLMRFRNPPLLFFFSPS